MGRTIITATDIREALAKEGLEVPAAPAPAAPQGAQADGYLDRVAKYIPADIVSVYLAAKNALDAADRSVAPVGVLHCVVFVGLLLLTPTYLKRVAGVTNKTQVRVSTLAFAVWVFALGGPFALLPPPWYLPLYGALLLPLFTFGVGVVTAEPKPG